MKLTIEDKRISSRYQLGHHRANLRQLFMEAFTSQEIHELIYDNPDFKNLAKQLPERPSHSSLVLSLLQYAERRLKIGRLLELAKGHNPKVYEDHQPYFQPGQITINATFTINGSDAQLQALKESFSALLEEKVSESLEKVLLQALRETDEKG